MSLQGKIAVITGGGSGIGRASALKLAENGVKIGVSDIDPTNAQETADMIIQAGGEAIAMACDVTNTQQVEAMVNQTAETFGGLHIALNNAGVGGFMTPVDKLEENIWDQTINVNLKGVWLCMKHEVPHILKSGGGSIINVASLAGLIGFRANAVYAASKHGVIGLTKSAALEYARLGLRVNAICPGFTETPMVTDMVEQVPKMGEATVKSSPMRRLGRVEEIADAVVYLAGDTSSFVNGHSLTLDGGASIQ